MRLRPPTKHSPHRPCRCGARIQAHDPDAKPNELGSTFDGRVALASDPHAACEQASALLITNDWNQFRQLDYPSLMQRLQTPVIYDGRNLLDLKVAQAAGFEVIGVGRRTSPPGAAATQ